MISNSLIQMTGNFNVSISISGTNCIAGCSQVGSLNGYSGNGIWYSSNSGATWTQSESFKTRGVRPVLIEGTNCIAGVELPDNQCSVIYSSDSGVTWQQSDLLFTSTGSITSTTNFFLLYMNGTNCLLGLALNFNAREYSPPRTLWYSSNLGQTWNFGSEVGTVNPVAGTVSSIMISNNSSVCVATLASSPASSLISNNYGLSWRVVGGNSNYSYITNSFVFIGSSTMIFYGTDLANFGSPGFPTNNVSVSNFNSVYGIEQKIIATSTTTGIWYSSNYGETWTRSTVFGTTTFMTGNFRIPFMSGSNCIAFCSSPTTSIGIWYSSDYGHTWLRSNLTLTVTPLSMSGSSCIAGSVNGLFYSTNSGETWTRSSTYKPLVNFTSISASNSNCIVSSSSSTGIWYSNNSGQTWLRSSNITSNFNSVSMSGSNCIGGSCNLGSVVATGLWYSSDSGQTWSQSSTNTTGAFKTVFISDNICVAGSEIGSTVSGLWYSSTSGKTWLRSTTSGVNTTGSYNSVHIDGFKCIAGSSSSTGLWYSSDSGQTWLQSTSNITGIFNSVFIAGSTCIAGSADGTGLWYSSDSGQTWLRSTTSMTSYTIGNFSSVSMYDKYCIAGSADGTGLWYSSDSGQTWLQSTSNTISSFYSVSMTGALCVAGSNSNGLWVSVDYGVTWIKYEDYPTTSFKSVGINPATINVISCSDNMIAYSLTIPCFNEDTKIIMLNDTNEEVYIPIKNLKVGDLVKTYKTGFVPIKYIKTMELLNCGVNMLLTMYRMKNTEILITGGHAILVDELTEEEEKKQINVGFSNSLYDKKYLFACFSHEFEEIKEKKVFNIFHLVLENDDPKCHYGIYCENDLLTETCSEEYFLTYLV